MATLGETTTSPSPSSSTVATTAAAPTAEQLATIAAALDTEIRATLPVVAPTEIRPLAEDHVQSDTIETDEPAEGGGSEVDEEEFRTLTHELDAIPSAPHSPEPKSESNIQSNAASSSSSAAVDNSPSSSASAFAQRPDDSPNSAASATSSANGDDDDDANLPASTIICPGDIHTALQYYLTRSLTTSEITSLDSLFKEWKIEGVTLDVLQEVLQEIKERNENGNAGGQMDASPDTTTAASPSTSSSPSSSTIVDPISIFANVLSRAHSFSNSAAMQQSSPRSSTESSPSAIINNLHHPSAASRVSFSSSSFTHNDSATNLTSLIQPSSSTSRSRYSFTSPAAISNVGSPDHTHEYHNQHHHNPHSQSSGAAAALSQDESTDLALSHIQRLQKHNTHLTEAYMKLKKYHLELETELNERITQQEVREEEYRHLKEKEEDMQHDLFQARQSESSLRQALAASISNCTDLTSSLSAARKTIQKLEHHSGIVRSAGRKYESELLHVRRTSRAEVEGLKEMLEQERRKEVERRELEKERMEAGENSAAVASATSTLNVEVDPTAPSSDSTLQVPFTSEHEPTSDEAAVLPPSSPTPLIIISDSSDIDLLNATTRGRTQRGESLMLELEEAEDDGDEDGEGTAASSVLVELSPSSASPPASASPSSSSTSSSAKPPLSSSAIKRRQQHHARSLSTLPHDELVKQFEMMRKELDLLKDVTMTQVVMKSSGTPLSPSTVSPPSTTTSTATLSPSGPTRRPIRRAPSFDAAAMFSDLTSSSSTASSSAATLSAAEQLAYERGYQRAKEEMAKKAAAEMEELSRTSGGCNSNKMKLVVDSGENETKTILTTTSTTSPPLRPAVANSSSTSPSIHPHPHAHLHPSHTHLSPPTKFSTLPRSFASALKVQTAGSGASRTGTLPSAASSSSSSASKPSHTVSRSLLFNPSTLPKDFTPGKYLGNEPVSPLTQLHRQIRTPTAGKRSTNFMNAGGATVHPHHTLPNSPLNIRPRSRTNSFNLHPNQNQHSPSSTVAAASSSNSFDPLVNHEDSQVKKGGKKHKKTKSINTATTNTTSSSSARLSPRPSTSSKSPTISPRLEAELRAAVRTAPTLAELEAARAAFNPTYHPPLQTCSIL